MFSRQSTISSSSSVQAPPAHDGPRLVRLDGQHSSASQTDLLRVITSAPIVPTVHPIDADTLCKFADVLHDEGYPAIELLSRPLPQALALLREVSETPQRTKIHWGLGTIRTPEDARQALALRPDFLVSPAFSDRVLAVSVEHRTLYIPGVLTLQDVQDVFDAFKGHGLEVEILKLCPVLGLSPQYVAMLQGCFPGIVFCPTGEVELENYLQWKSTPGIVAPMGSSFIPRSLLEARDFVAVRDRLRLIRDLAEVAAAQAPPL